MSYIYVCVYIYINVQQDEQGERAPFLHSLAPPSSSILVSTRGTRCLTARPLAPPTSPAPSWPRLVSVRTSPEMDSAGLVRYAARGRHAQKSVSKFLCCGKALFRVLLRISAWYAARRGTGASWNSDQGEAGWANGLLLISYLALELPPPRNHR